MNELITFEHPQFGELRGLLINDDPWFVGKDVAESLGYQNPSKALADHVDPEDKLNNDSLSSLGQRGGWLINESGLYCLALRSQLQEAKQFRRWVTHEVIPSIRKTGMYATPATIDNILANPDMFIQLLQEYKAEQQKNMALTEQVDQQKQLIQDMVPKVEFANSISAAGTEIGVGELAKLMRQNGIKIGEKRLYKELRDDGYIMQNSCMPTQYAMERGWFRVIERDVTLPTGNKIATKTTKVTMKGQVDLINKYFDKHIDDIF